VLRIFRYASALRSRISCERRMSSRKSIIETHKRRISAPRLSATSWGEMTLPSDFDILRPWPSIVKPCVTTPL
jgi:hypothetical protein